jgi:hypothetical protein
MRSLEDTNANGQAAESAGNYTGSGASLIEHDDASITPDITTTKPCWVCWKASSNHTNPNIQTIDNAGVADVLTDVDYFGFHKNYGAGDQESAGLSFRGGDMEVIDTTVSRGGFAVISNQHNYGAGYDISGHDIAVELWVQSTTGLESIVIAADSQDTDPRIDYADSDFDSYCKLWTITPAMWAAAGCDSGFGRIVLKDEQATWIGPNFTSTSVNQMVVFPNYNSNSQSSITDPNLKANHLLAVRELSTIAPQEEAGWGDSEYSIHQTQINNGVESLLATYDGTFKGGSSDAKFQIHMPYLGETAPGGKLYYQELGKSGEPLSDHYLLGEWDFDDGWKSVLDNEFTVWDGNNEASTVFLGPPKFSTYNLESGYPDGVEEINARWKYSASTNRVTYIGNIQQPIDYDLTMDDITWNNGTILKSVPGKPAGFADNQFIDLELKEDYITGMTSIGDRLLIFTRKKLFIVNVAQDIEFLEDELNMLGIDGPKQFCLMEDGIAIVNGNGLYYFSPNSKDLVTNLSEKVYPAVKFDYDGSGNSNTSLIYEPLKKILAIFVNSNDHVLYWSWKTKTFVGQSLRAIQLKPSKSNVVHTPPYLVLSTTVTPSMLSIYKATDASFNFISYYGSTFDGNQGIITEYVEIDYRDTCTFTTGTISCGDINRRKKFYKLYFNAHNPLGDNKGLIAYSLDKGTNWVYPSGQDDGNTVSEGENTITLNATGKHITIKIVEPTGGTIETSQSFSDISLVYRERSIK